MNNKTTEIEPTLNRIEFRATILDKSHVELSRFCPGCRQLAKRLIHAGYLEYLNQHRKRIKNDETTEPKQNKQAVVIYGNPVDGIKIIGSFNSLDEATKYADIDNPTDEWWITELNAPEVS